LTYYGFDLFALDEPTEVLGGILLEGTYAPSLSIL